MSLGFTVAQHASLHADAAELAARDIDGPADLVEEVLRIHGLADVASVPLTRDAAVANRCRRRPSAGHGRCGGRGGGFLLEVCLSFSFIAVIRPNCSAAAMS